MALLKRILRPFYRATKKVLRPIADRIRGPLSRILYPPEFETVFCNLEQITNNLKGFLDQSDQMLLAMFRTMHLPPPAQPGPVTQAVNLGNGRILANHPAVPFVFVDANDLRETPNILRNVYQPHVTEAIRRLVRPGDCCVDLGAGIGYHTLTMASAAGKDSQSAAVELDANRAAMLRDSLTATDLIDCCASFQHAPGASVTEALRWLSLRLASRGGVPDLVRIGGGFDTQALRSELRTWTATDSTRFLLSTGSSWSVTGDLPGYSYWRIAPDGSLFRAPLGEIEELGRQHEVHFVAAKMLV